MNNDQLDDLKQFIDSRISQSEAWLEKKIDAIDEKVDELRKEMNDGFAGVGEALDEMNKHTDERLTKLEQQTV